MRRSIASFRQAEARRKEAEQCYVETAPECDLLEELETRLILHDLVSASTRPQYELATLRLQGYSIAETARKCDMTPKRVRNLLMELYRVYFQLYPKEQGR